MRLLRDRPIIVIIALLWLALMALGCWGDWYNYAQEAADHHQHAEFWSWGFFAEYVSIQFSMNLQADVLGAGLILVLVELVRRAKGKPNPPDEELAGAGGS